MQINKLSRLHLDQLTSDCDKNSYNSTSNKNKAVPEGASLQWQNFGHHNALTAARGQTDIHDQIQQVCDITPQ